MPKFKKPDTKAKRLKWPKYKNDDGTFTDEYEEYARDMGVCYDLVSIARGVLGRPLVLKAGGERDGIVRPATDGTNIFLPKMHPNRRISLKHELAHIYFKSNIPLRLLFVKELLSDMERISGKEFPSVIREKLIDDLCFVVNILDDVRVNSLWGLLYPGDGRDMEEWYFGEIGPQQQASAAEAYPNGDIDHLFTYMILVCLRQRPTSSKWGAFYDDIVRAREEVHFKSFNACLVIMKGLVLKIAKKIAEDLKMQEQQSSQPPPWGGNPKPLDNWDDKADEADKSAGGGDVAPEGDIDDLIKQRIEEKAKEQKEKVDLVSALTKAQVAQRPPDSFVNDNAGYDYKDAPKDPPSAATRDIAKSLSNIDTDDEEAVSDFLDQQDAQGAEEAASLQAAMATMSGVGGGPATEGEYLKKAVKADLNLLKIPKAEIVPTVLTHEELRVAERWRRFFQRVMGTLAVRTEEEGSDLVTDLYIQQLLNKEPFSCFRRETTGRGFRLTILVDMSGSMYGCFDQVSRLARVMQIALDFPFVHLNIMGFNALEKGTVNIYIYPKNTPGLISPKSKTEGVTPLSHAIQVAGRGLVGCRDDSHLFVLTDGMPVYQLKSGGLNGRSSSVDIDTLMNWTTSATTSLQKQKVKTWCFMIGAWSPTDAQMDRMFGRPYWRKIPTESVYDASFRFVTEKFLNYLKSR